MLVTEALSTLRTPISFIRFAIGSGESNKPRQEIKLSCLRRAANPYSLFCTNFRKRFVDKIILKGILRIILLNIFRLSQDYLLRNERD
jgi:hypothetical protein